MTQADPKVTFDDPLELSIFSNLVAAVTEEASVALARTAYTTFIKEAQDFSVALARPDGSFFAFPSRSGVPTAVALPMEDVIAAIDHWEPGDVVMTNDPYSSGGMVTHSPDITILAPVFSNGRVIAFVWSFLHSSDVGGAVPGSLAASLTDVFQEGIRIPPSKLYEKGVLNDLVYQILMNNVRVPDQLWGDVQAMLSGIHVARKRLEELVGRYGDARSRQLIDGCLDYSEAKARAVIQAMPDGVYEFHDYLDDDIVSDHPVRIGLEVMIDGAEIRVDYTKTDPQVRAAFNLATAGKKAHTWLTVGILQFLLTADSGMPVNSGILRPISVTAPAGTIVHAVPPASLGGRAISGIRVMDATFGALVQAMPDHVPAAGSGQGLLPVISTQRFTDGKRKVNILQPLVGGTGARPNADGYDGTNYSLSFMQNTPVEVIESEMDVWVHRYHFVCDSGGAGEHRGGMGVGIEVEARKSDTVIALRAGERTKFAPWGVNGGMCGSRTKPPVVTRANGRKDHYTNKDDKIELNPGDNIKFETSGGGGFGDPRLRPVDRVLNDMMSGFVSSEAAAKDYGLVFQGDGTFDREATDRERAKLSGKGKPALSFTYCDYRLAHEALWTDEAYDHLYKILRDLPVHVRGFAKGAIMDQVVTSGHSHGLSGEEVEGAWETAKVVLGLSDKAHAQQSDRGATAQAKSTGSV